MKMTDLLRAFRYPLHVHLSTAFVLLVVLVGALVAGVAFVQSKTVIKKLTTDTFERIADDAAVNTARVFSPAEAAVDLMAAHRVTWAKSLDERLVHSEFMLTALDRSPNVTSVYLGYLDGDFLLFRRLPNTPLLKARFDPPKGTVYVAQSIERDGKEEKGAYVYFGADHNIIERREKPDYTSYDPRKRPWFVRAGLSKGQIKTDPYIFFTTQEVGTTIARRAIKAPVVVATDMTLQTLAGTLKNFKVTPNTDVALLTTAGKLVAHPNPASVLKLAKDGEKPEQAGVESLANEALKEAYSAFMNDNQTLLVTDNTVSGNTWRTMATTVPLEGSEPYILTIAAPTDELLADADAMVKNAMYWLAAAILVVLPLSLYLGRLVATPINSLASETEAIRRFEFHKPIKVRSIISDVDDLATAMGGMKATIQQFLDISTAIAAEEDFDHLLDLVVDETIAASKAAGGVIYLLNDNETHLVPTVIRGHDRDILPVALPELLINDPGAPIAEAISLGAVAQTVIDPRLEQGNSSSGFLHLVKQIDDDECHVVAIPLFNRSRELVGVLALFMTDEVDSSRVSFVTALSGTAAVSVESRQLIEAQKTLFESFIQMIADAIDAKSAYTGGHCARVPQLTKMLAEAAVQSKDGPYQDFTLSDEDWEAVHIASWLHDCGKMTTPEYVVDKATKLETIYDRIHEIRMRFEILKREAEINCWQAIAEGGDAATLKEKLQEKQQKLDDDFAFVASCNEGREFLDEDKAERLRTIAGLTWQRTLDDRIGISYEERARKEASGPAVSLPTKEPLLSDKPEHRIERQEKDRIGANNPWNFKVRVPDLLYNRGELYNLLVGRGTLSEEERFKINEHIIQTIVMLSQLPFPKHLRNVPEIAGGHHEKMDGTGYPKQLTKDQMSPVARMMAIADIFEALTAVDRPYKKGKTLSEAIRIMSFMRNDHHIDAELFDLFLRSGVYKQYAEEHMKPEQIDTLKIEEFLKT